MIRRTYAGLRLALLAFLLLSGCVAASEAVTMKLSWQHGIQFLGFYVAQERGYYAEEGLSVTIEPLHDSAEMDETPERVAAGEFDFPVGGTAGLLANWHAPVTIIAAIYQFGAAALFARADSGINTPRDLAGHSVLIKSESWRTVIAAMLDSAGLSLDDIKAVPGGYDMTPFYEGEVEVWAGFITNEVVRARQRGMDIVTLPMYEYGLKRYDNMVFTSQAALAEDPDRAARFLRGWEWAVENPVEAVDVMLERFPEMAAERDFHLASFEASTPLIAPGGTPVGTIDCQAPMFREQRLPEAFCSTEILAGIREGE